MIEFVLKNRKLRLHPDGVIYSRSINKFGEETKKETWKSIKFSNSNGYLTCSLSMDGELKKLYKHRIVYYAYNQDWDIFNCDPNNCIDHRNRNRSDNRIENLHVVTDQENHFNRDVKGITWEEAYGKWKAQIGLNYKTIFLGRFVTEEEAHNAYLKAKEEYHINV